MARGQKDLLFGDADVSTAKARGGYYTPESVVATLIGWAVHETSDRLLTPPVEMVGL